MCHFRVVLLYFVFTVNLKLMWTKISGGMGEEGSADVKRTDCMKIGETNESMGPCYLQTCVAE